MISLLLKLLVAHVLGDFVFQPDSWIADKKQKKQKSRYLYLHLGVHALALIVFLKLGLGYWPIVVTIIVSHFIIDLLKLHLEGKMNARLLFVLDQLAHLLVIGVLVSIYETYRMDIEILYSPKSLTLLLALLSVTYVSAIVMKLLMSKWSLEEEDSNDSLEHAGKYIGMLERLFVFAFIVLNQWQAIGLLIAAKSVFRFGDLSRAKDRKLTEYILIGTLLSFGLAMIIGLGYNSMVKLNLK